MAASNAVFWNFFAKVRKTPHCWEWKGGTWVRGHPMFWLKRQYHARRVAFYLTRGYWPKGWAINICRVKWCVNPSHIQDLPPNSIGEALRASGVCRKNRRKRCRRNLHPMSGDNIKIMRGERRCRECYNEKRRAYWHRSLKFTHRRGIDRSEEKANRCGLSPESGQIRGKEKGDARNTCGSRTDAGGQVEYIQMVPSV